MRGKLNGSKMSKGRSVQTLTNKIKGSNPQSSYQSQVRSIFRKYTEKWRTLSDAQILAWNAAALESSKSNFAGAKYHTTGHKLFVTTNVNAIKNGGTEILAPVAVAIPVIVDIETLVLTVSGQVVSFVTTEALETGCKLLVKATPPVSNGKTNLKGLFRQVALLDYPLVAGVNVISSAYTARFGAFAAGKKIAIQAYTIAVGGSKQFKAEHDLVGKTA